MNEQTLIHWQGPGWYAERASCGPRGEGGVQAWAISHRKNEYRDKLDRLARRAGLGTPFWLDSKDGSR